MIKNESLVGQESQNKNSTVRLSPKIKKKNIKDIKVFGARVLLGCEEQYDVVGEIIRANARIIIGQQVRGEDSLSAATGENCLEEKL